MKAELQQYERKNSIKLSKWRWIICIALAVFIVFSFILILLNVSYPDHEVTAAVRFPLGTVGFKRSSGFALNEIPNPLECISVNDDPCEPYCFGNVESNLSQKLDQQHQLCRSSLNLILANCTFPNSTLTANTFNGTYSLNTLNITNCKLTHIENGTFAQPPVVDLRELHFNFIHVEVLDDKSFHGLRSLKSFTIENNYNDSLTTFNGIGYLKPVASTLNNLRLKHLTLAEYDPAFWLGETEFHELFEVDFSENNFTNILKNHTFQKLIAVKALNLRSCAIMYLEAGTFGAITKTLQYLDLRDNQLIHLNVDFVEKIQTDRFVLELAFNNWNCSCENQALIQLIEANLIDFTETPKCATPLKWRNQHMDNITLNCCENGDDDDDTCENITIEPETTENTTECECETEEPTTVEQTTECETEEPTTIEDTTQTTPPRTTTTQWPTNSIATSDYPTSQTTEIFPPTPTTQTYPTTQTTETTSQFPPLNPPRSIRCVPRNELEGYQDLRINNNDANYTIRTVAIDSVELSIDYFTMSLKLAYFMPKMDATRKLLGHWDSNMSSVLITNLTDTKEYVFCLLRVGEQRTSPFNCRSHKLELLISNNNVWLINSDKPLFLGLSILGVIICILISGIGVYFLLRWRPTWLKGCQRIRRVNANSECVFLYAEQSSTTRNCCKRPFFWKGSTHPQQCSETNRSNVRNFQNDSYELSTTSRNFSESPKNMGHYEEVF